MRIVLQDVESSLYFSKLGWTSSFKEARDFGRIQQAIEYSCEHDLFNVQVIIVMQPEQGGLQFIPFQIQSIVQDSGGRTTRPDL
jgi:hypothetical protein